jgi:hypothetical protein
LKGPQAMKRRWFQIHLSTAIVMMFVAGGLLWINLKEPSDEPVFEKDVNYVIHGRGWPLPTCRIVVVAGESPRKAFLSAQRHGNEHESILLIDAAIALTIVWMTGMGLESIIRRREARKP